MLNEVANDRGGRIDERKNTAGFLDFTGDFLEGSGPGFKIYTEKSIELIR
jgi:hypothetical protein